MGATEFTDLGGIEVENGVIMSFEHGESVVVDFW